MTGAIFQIETLQIKSPPINKYLNLRTGNKVIVPSAFYLPNKATKWDKRVWKILLEYNTYDQLWMAMTLPDACSEILIYAKQHKSQLFSLKH